MSETVIGTAYFKLMPSMAGTEAAVNKGLKSAKVVSAGSSAGASIGASMVTGIGSKISAGAVALGNVLASAVTAAAAGLGDIVSDAIDLSDSMKKLGTTMSFAGFDEATVQAAQQQVKWYADQTVYDLGVVANTVAQLGANGVEEFVGLTMAAGNLNAAAGGDAQTFESLAMVLTQTAGAGKLTTENWNQLANAIPGASGVLQQALLDAGAYTGNFREALEKGEISAEEFNAAIISLGWQDAAWEASTSTQTMEGAMGNFSAAVTGAMSEVYDAINGDGRITGAIVALGDGIGGLISSTAEPLGTLAGEVWSAIEEIGQSAEELAPHFEPFEDTFERVSEAVGLFAADYAPTLLDSFSGLGEAVVGVIDALAPLSDPAGNILGTAFEDAAIIVNTVVEALTEVMEIASDILTLDISSALDGIGDVVYAIGGGLNDLIDTTFPGLVSFVDGLITDLSDFSTNASAFVTAPFTILGERMGAALSDAADNASTWWSENIATPFSEGVSEAGTALAELPEKVGTALAGIPAKIATGVDEAKAKWDEKWAEVASGVSTWWGGVVDSFTGFFAEIGTTIESWDLASKFETAVSAVVGVVEVPLGLVSDLVTGLWTNLLDFWASVSSGDWSGAVDAVTGVAETWGTYLVNLADTVFPGAAEAIDGFLEKASGIKDDVLNAFSGIAEPVGEFIGGIKTTWDTKFAEISTGVSEWWTGVTDTFTGALASLGIDVESWNIAEKFTDAVSTVQGIIEAPFSGAIEFIRGIPDQIVGFFTGIGQSITDAIGNISFPTPHVTWESVSIFGMDTPISLPHIDWYGTGGIIDGARIVGVGERGPEAIVPLYGNEMLPFAEAVAAGLNSMSTTSGGDVYNVYLDGEALRADEQAIELLREFVAGIVQTNGRKAVFA